MKSIVFSLFCLLFLVTTLAMAQDTVNVAPGTGTIAAAVAADTVGGASHFPANRVYKLTRGGNYYFNGAITTNGFPLRIVGGGAPINAANDPGPAFIQATNPGAGPDNLINAYGDLTLKNVWITSYAQGNANQWQNLSENSPNTTIIIDGCIFDYSQGVTLIIQTTHIKKYSSTNTIYRNQTSPSQWWCGRPNYFNSCAVDTVWVENNTFVNEGFSFQEQDYGNTFFWWNHNTLVNTAKFAMLNEQWHTAYVANSIFYNSHFTGERLKQDAPGQDPNGRLYGAVMDIDTLLFKKGSDTNVTDPNQKRIIENGRFIKLAYNANYREPYYQTFYTQYNTDKHAVLPTIPGGTPGVDTALMAEPFVNLFTLGLFSDGKHTNMSMKHNMDTYNPGFVQAPTNSDSIKAFLHSQFYGTGVNVDWSWDGGSGATYKQYLFPWNTTNAGLMWRVPENLSYSNAAMKTFGTGGYPVGDLNWFPTQKAAWLAAGGSAADMTALNALTAGADPLLSVQPVPGAAPARFELEANYPNPFNPSTTIKYSLSATSNVKLVVYDVLGREVRTLVNGNMPAGSQSVQWDGRDAKGNTVGSGVYFYKLTAGSFVSTKKMMMLK